LHPISDGEWRLEKPGMVDTSIGTSLYAPIVGAALDAAASGRLLKAFHLD
jgi:hypothetical protein